MMLTFVVISLPEWVDMKQNLQSKIQVNFDAYSEINIRTITVPVV